jgi:hypothetical protein
MLDPSLIEILFISRMAPEVILAMDEGQYDGKVETICYYNIAFVNSER